MFELGKIYDLFVLVVGNVVLLVDVVVAIVFVTFVVVVDVVVSAVGIFVDFVIVVELAADVGCVVFVLLITFDDSVLCRHLYVI